MRGRGNIARRMTSSSPSAPRRLRVRTRSYARVTFGLGLIGLATAGMVASLPHLLGHPQMFFAVVASVLVGAAGVFVALAAVVSPQWRAHEALVDAQDGYVTFDGAAMRERVSGARIEPEAVDARWRVTLFAGGRHPEAHVYFASQEDAAAFVATVTPTVINELLSFRVPVLGDGVGWITTVVLWAGLLGALVVVLFTPVAGPFAILGALPGLLLMMVPRRIDVGTDGIALRWMGHTTLIPYASIENVRVERGTLVLRVRGRRIPLRVGATAHGDASAAGSLDTLMARIVRHQETGSANRVSLNAELDMDLSDREAWIARLRALARPGYRQLALSPMALWEVLHDPASTEAARISAAMLLRDRLDADGVRRLRVFTEAAVSPTLRDAFEQIANDPEPLAEEDDPRDAARSAQRP
jgi:hypothetical protein